MYVCVSYVYVLYTHMYISSSIIWTPLIFEDWNTQPSSMLRSLLNRKHTRYWASWRRLPSQGTTSHHRAYTALAYAATMLGNGKGGTCILTWIVTRLASYSRLACLMALIIALIIITHRVAQSYVACEKTGLYLQFAVLSFGLIYGYFTALVHVGCGTHVNCSLILSGRRWRWSW